MTVANGRGETALTRFGGKKRDGRKLAQTLAWRALQSIVYGVRRMAAMIVLELP